MKNIFLTIGLALSACVQAQTFKNPKGIFDPTPYGFSHTATAEGPGALVFISGQSGGDGLSHDLSPDFRTQTRIALKNLVIALESHQLKPENVMKITILIVDHDLDKLTIWNEEIRKVWGKHAFPASTLIPVPKLALDGMQIEVDAVAFKKK